MSLSRFVVFSSLCHVFIFGSQSLLGFFYSKPQFAVEVASSSVDVAILEEVKEEPPKEEVAEIKEEKTEIILPKEESKIPPKVDAPKLLPSHLSRGAVMHIQPNYMRNPAPRYPVEARVRGWEGVVSLVVLVSENGAPKEVRVEKSSGYSVLDEAALEAVRNWQFLPSRLANVALASWVKIPVRFDLVSEIE